MSRIRWGEAVGGGVLILLIVVNVIVTHHVLTAPHPGHNDFMSRWEGARSYWREGLNPYGDQASLNIQQRIYGRAAEADEDPGYFAYPFYTVFLIWPLVYLSYAWASAIWMVLLEAALIGALILLLDLYGWRPRPLVLAALLITALVCYFPARGLILGQPGLVVYAFEVLALWALARQRDRLAGAALALSTIKPQMGFLLIPLLLLWGWRARRWAFLGAFGLVWGGLMVASFALLPTWLGDWIAQLRRYPSYTDLGAPIWIVMQYYLGLGALGEWIVTGALWGGLLWAWYSVLGEGRSERLLWVVMLTLTVTHLSAVRTATPHYVVFAIPLIFYCKALAQQRAGAWWVAAILVALIVIPWAQFLLTVEGRDEHASLYLPVPALMLVVLWITRQQWWRAPHLL